MCYRPIWVWTASYMPNGWLGCFPVAAMADLQEQPFIAHAGEVAARDTNVREILGSHFAPLSYKEDGAFPQG
jgi:hypothetical protein